MNYKNVSELVSKIIQSAKEDYIEIKKDDGEVIKYNQRKVINRINHYINNRFVDRDDDAIFWNLSNHRRIHFAKLLGVDTKDFMPYGQGEYNFVQAWALRKKLREWFDENEFYQVLNDISEGEATYGSVVWKKYKDGEKVELEEVNLLNLYFDQSVKCIEDTDVVELHNLTKNQLWDKNEVWDKVPEVIKKMGDKAEIWEFTGYFSTDDTEEPTRKHCVGYGYGDEAVILFDEDIDEEYCLYYDFHLGRYVDRWLRVGVVERLFKLQAQANKLVNQNDQYNDIASLLLLKSSSVDSTGNVLEQAISGQIIGDPTLEQVGISNTGFNQFVSQLQQIEAQADKLCLTPDIIQGEQSPSGTPFRSLAVVNSAAMSAFTAYKQDLGEKIGYIILTEILPELVKKWNRGVIVDIMEDDEDIAMYDESLVREMKKQYLLEVGLVTPDVEQMIRMKIETDIKGVGRRVVMDKNWINFKYGIRMAPTSETVDKAAKNDAYFNALQMIGANPNLINIPLFKQYLEDNGISWWKMTSKQVQEIQQGATGANMPQAKQPDALLATANPQG